MDEPENSAIVNLGPLRTFVESRLRSGAYGSLEELIHAALLALEREETASDLLKPLLDGAPTPPKLRTNKGEAIHEVRSFRFRSEDRDF